jgi:hypothetical protein
MLLADLDAPPKQRHTAQRIFDRLVEGHEADDISYSMVRAYVKDRRKEVRRQAGVGPDHGRVGRQDRRGTRRRLRHHRAGSPLFRTLGGRPGTREAHAERPLHLVPHA